MTSFKITFSALLICLLVVVKLKFLINIDGLELVTFLVVTYGIYFQFKYNLLLVIAFNFFVALIYGFGVWWLAYWYIWPFELLLVAFLTRFMIKSPSLTAIIVGLFGFSIWIFYFPLHWLVLGYNGAVGFVFPGIIVNLVEGSFNFIVCIILFIPIRKLFLTMFRLYEHRFKLILSDQSITYFQSLLKHQTLLKHEI